MFSLEQLEHTLKVLDSELRVARVADYAVQCQIIKIRNVGFTGDAIESECLLDTSLREVLFGTRVRMIEEETSYRLYDCKITSPSLIQHFNDVYVKRTMFAPRKRL